jgi:hypothetical protein
MGIDSRCKSLDVRDRAGHEITPCEGGGLGVGVGFEKCTEVIILLESDCLG